MELYYTLKSGLMVTWCALTMRNQHFCRFVRGVCQHNYVQSWYNELMSGELALQSGGATALWNASNSCTG